MKRIPIFAALLFFAEAVAVPILVPAPREASWGKGNCTGGAVVSEATDTSLPREGYRLSVDAAGVRIAAADRAGLRWARETLAQLAVRDEAGAVRYPVCEIRDWPAYPWRGVLVDEGRHFFGKAAIKKMIEAMALHKLNVLHWHLTEDQGWRIDLKKYPELAKWGAARAETPIWGELREGDGRPYGPYFYTEEEIAEVVEFAETHGVKIVPELEIPGHSRAALAAYPEYSCLGKDLPRRPDSTWGVKRELYCAGNDAALRFLEGVLDEFCRLFKYSDTIHIGGDECPKARWRNCPKCQARIKSLGLKDEDALQSWMTRHFAEYLARKGKRAIGWEEILDGGIPEGACVMSWLGPKGALKAVTNGVDCVVCPTTHCYFDQQQNLKDDPWRSGGGGLPLEKVYGFDPSAGIPADCRSRVLGSQGLLWSESIACVDELFWMGFPRLCAMAEVLWTADPKRDYKAFVQRLAVHVPRLRASGVNAAGTPEGVPVNAAVAPTPKNGNTSYDWMGRHAYVCAEQVRWRSQPDVVLIGDSITHYWSGVDSIGELDDSRTLPRWREAFGETKTLNMGFASDRTQNVLWRLENGELKNCSPKLVVLMVGINNVYGSNIVPKTTPEDTVAGVRRIIGLVRQRVPQAEIALMGLLPAHAPGTPERAATEKVNRLLARVPRYGYEGHVHFVDVGEKFLGAGGEIPRALLYDGVHPTDAGYRIWARALRPYLERLAKKSGK